MRGAALRTVLGRLWPRRMRTRLAVMYTILFLLAGTVLLALTYTLVTNVLLPAPSGPDKQVARVVGQLAERCKQREAPGEPALSRALLVKCNRAFAAVGPGPAAREHTLSALRGASLIGLGFLVVASAGLGWLVAGRALGPVRSITDAARQASELRLGQRLGLTGPDDELKQLADTFDVMLERLDAAFTSQKRFVANAAHELRTPLTAMRTAIEVTLSKPVRTPAQLEAMAAQVKRSVERAEATIEALLTLASSELGPRSQESVDLATAAADALQASRVAIAERRLTVDSALDPAPALGDRVLLERMIANLVENAVRHNEPGGSIAVRTVRQGDASTFEISNTGPEIAAEMVPTLFEPFARAKQRLNSTDGVGLSLSIASAIATAHNATISARPRAGGGLETSVTIPSAGA